MHLLVAYSGYLNAVWDTFWAVFNFSVLLTRFAKNWFCAAYCSKGAWQFSNWSFSITFYIKTLMQIDVSILYSHKRELNEQRPQGDQIEFVAYNTTMTFAHK